MFELFPFLVAVLVVVVVIAVNGSVQARCSFLDRLPQFAIGSGARIGSNVDESDSQVSQIELPSLIFVVGMVVAMTGYDITIETHVIR